MLCVSVQRSRVFVLVIAVVLGFSVPRPAIATAYSIPVNGRFGSSKIVLEIPSTPKWAHDIVVNASLVWNRGQLLFRHTYFPEGDVYTFVEGHPANVSVNYALPLACAGFAVGWTDYTFAPTSNTIISARTFLNPSIFNATGDNNATLRQYAFRLALHEMGRVLGLGNLIDGNDIMDPLATPSRAMQPPMISTLDLFAVHVLASENTLSSMVIVLNTDQYQLLNAWSLLTGAREFISSLDSPAMTFANGHSNRSNINETSDIDHQQRWPDQLRSGTFKGTVTFTGSPLAPSGRVPISGTWESTRVKTRERVNSTSIDTLVTRIGFAYPT